MSEQTVSIRFHAERLESYSDEFIAALWHTNNFCGAPFGDPQAEKLGDNLAREMARRFLLKLGAPDMWVRQARHVEDERRLAAERAGEGSKA